MQKWEYFYIETHRDTVTRVNAEAIKHVENNLPKWLWKCGEDGWELVGVSNISNSGVWDLLFVFKRLKE